MAVLVSDTSVIIDLERGTLLDDLFRLPFEFAVPDLLFRRELAGPLGDRLVALGLRVEELTSIELTRATTVRRERKELSTADTFAFAIAECRGWPLLTGDSGLRRLAVECRVEFHGVLWICDQFENGVVPLTRLHAGLTALCLTPVAGSGCGSAPTPSPIRRIAWHQCSKTSSEAVRGVRVAAGWPQPSVWPAKNILLTPGRTKGRLLIEMPRNGRKGLRSQRRSRD